MNRRPDILDEMFPDEPPRERQQIHSRYGPYYDTPLQSIHKPRNVAEFVRADADTVVALGLYSY
jgi:hypothetical protein